MKRVSFIVLAGAVLLIFVTLWHSPRKTEDSFIQIERSLESALRQLRDTSETERKTDGSLAARAMAFADALTEGGDVRQKQMARDARAEVGRILFGENAAARSGGDGAVRVLYHVVRFPDPLPEQRSTSLPFRAYIGTYAGTIAGRPVSFIVSVTDRELLGIRITGLGDQPTMEFAEAQPQEFFRPDTKTVFVFADPTESGFRTLYFLQNGTREKAENALVSAAARK